MHRPVRLRRVDAGLAHLATLIGAGRRAELVLGDMHLLLEAGAARPARQSPGPWLLCLDTPCGPIALAPLREVMRALTALDLPDAHDEADPLHRLALDLALQTVPAGWFDLFGASGFLVRVEDLPGRLTEVTLTFVQPEARFGMAARLIGTAEALQHALARPAWRRMRRQPSTLPPEWTLKVPVCVGHTTLPLQSLRALAVGDAVVITAPRFEVDGHGEVQIGPRKLKCRLLIGNQAQLEFTEWHATTMDSTMQASDSDTPATTDFDLEPDEDARDGIPVKLSFELGEMELPLAEVDAFAPGSVVSIAGPLPPQVIIRAGGHWIGTGELVELDGRLGVEIRRLGRAS